MKKLLVLFLIALFALTMAGCDSGLTARADYIGLDAAKTVALEDAGVDASSATFSTAELDRRDGIEYYDLDFVSGGQEYEYDVNAITGQVISRQGAAADPAGTTAPADDGQSTTTQTPTTGGQTTTPSAGGQTGTAAITAEQAKAAALSHAGLTAAQVTFLTCQLEYDDGRQLYDVEFYTSAGQEYDYEIDAATGAVLQYDYDAEHALPQTSGGQNLTAEQAKQVALAQVPGATASDIYGFEADYDDGRMQYEGTIVYNGMEYEFEIDGYSGSIRSWESERVGA